MELKIVCLMALKIIAIQYTLVDSARILGVFTTGSRSHFGFHEAMMRSLVKAGHSVTMIAPPYQLEQPMDNFTIIGTRSKNLGIKSAMEGMSQSNFSFTSMFLKGVEIMENECYIVMNGLSQIQDIMNADEKPFDLMFVELMPLYECYMPIAKKLDIPTIGTISFRSYQHNDAAVGNSRNPSIFPAEFSFVNWKMSFRERLINTLNLITLYLLTFYDTHRVDLFYRELFPNMDYRSFKKHSLIFCNSHVSFFPRLTAPNYIEIGGIGVKMVTLKPLSKDVKEFLDGAKNGAILFSLGSIATSSSISADLLDIFRKVFAEIPQRVIWKFDIKIENLTNNVLVADWTEQKEILAHTNLLAFISHCGLNSVNEAVYYGKPLIMIPIFGDQTGNVAMLNSKEVGIYLDISKLTKETLLESIRQILTESRYRENMMDLSRKFKDDLVSPEKKVVYWTEYVLKYKGAVHLRLSEADIPLYQYFLLDVIFVFILTLVFIIVLIKYLKKKISNMFGKLKRIMSVGKKVENKKL